MVELGRTDPASDIGARMVVNGGGKSDVSVGDMVGVSGPVGASCSQGGGGTDDLRKGGAKTPPSTGLGPPPQNPCSTEIMSPGRENNLESGISNQPKLKGNELRKGVLKKEHMEPERAGVATGMEDDRGHGYGANPLEQVGH